MNCRSGFYQKAVFRLTKNLDKYLSVLYYKNRKI